MNSFNLVLAKNLIDISAIFMPINNLCQKILLCFCCFDFGYKTVIISEPDPKN